MTKRKDGRHSFNWLKYNGKNVAIDKEIVPLLSKMWKLGIKTTASCQQVCSFACKHKRKVVKSKDGNYLKPIYTKHCLSNIWLAFESAKDVEALYNYVAEYKKPATWEEARNSMYGLMNCDLCTQNTKNQFLYPDNAWAFLFVMANNGVYGHWGRPTFNGKRVGYEMWIKDGCKKNNFVIEPQITFPRLHLQYVEERLDLAISKKR